MNALMEGFSAAATTICVMALICMLLEALVPPGRLRESVRTIIGLVFLITVVQPVMNIFV